MIPRTRHDWEHGPPYIRRKHGFIMITMAVMGFIGVVLSQSWMVFGFRGPWWRLPLAFGWLVLTVIVMAVSLKRLHRQLRRDFEAAAGRLCTHCAYNLQDLPPTGGCPECGHEYDAEFDARTWHGAGFEMPEQVKPPPSGSIS